MLTKTGKRNKFRNNRPARRKVQYDPNINYSSYKDYLKEDFLGRCGYCDDYYGIVRKDYHIDHFVPQRLIKKFPSHSQLLNDYNNLVFSCPTCNKSKSGKWPSEHPDKPIINDEGFIDPCNEEYDNLFYRDESGAIRPQQHSKIANYIYRELKLYLKCHEIVWKIENLMHLAKEMEVTCTNKTADILVKQLLAYLEEYFEMGLSKNGTEE